MRNELNWIEKRERENREGSPHRRLGWRFWFRERNPKVVVCGGGLRNEESMLRCCCYWYMLLNAKSDAENTLTLTLLCCVSHYFSPSNGHATFVSFVCFCWQKSCIYSLSHSCCYLVRSIYWFFRRLIHETRTRDFI